MPLFKLILFKPQHILHNLSEQCQLARNHDRYHEEITMESCL